MFSEAAQLKWPIQMTRAVPVLAALGFSSVTLHGCADQSADRSMSAIVDLLPTHINNWTRSESAVTYDRETIFDYIDGAGEVYRSFAFQQVAVASYSSPDRPDLLVELFDMGNSADAYGVFSYAREHEEAGIGGGFERKGRVLCFWQDQYYACVSSEDDTPSDSVLVDVASAVSERLPPAAAPPILLSALPTDGLVPFSDRFFHLHQSLNYHYYLTRDNILNLAAGTDAVLARYEPGSTYLLIVQYQDTTDAMAALSSFRQAHADGTDVMETIETENEKFLTFKQNDRYVIVVLDAGSETSAEQLMQAALSRLPALQR
jgi:hypothetical protein